MSGDVKSMREIYMEATVGKTLPMYAIVTGELINLALGTDEYEPERAYSVTPEGIEPIE